MQLYRYHCPECSHTFRRILSDGNQPQLTCPNCGGVAEQEGADTSVPSPTVATAAGQPPGSAQVPMNGTRAVPAAVGDACDLDGH